MGRQDGPDPLVLKIVIVDTEASAAIFGEPGILEKTHSSAVFGRTKLRVIRFSLVKNSKRKERLKFDDLNILTRANGQTYFPPRRLPLRSTVDSAPFNIPIRASAHSVPPESTHGPHAVILAEQPLQEGPIIMKRFLLFAVCIAMISSSGCLWRRPCGCGYGAQYGGGAPLGGGCSTGSCGAAPYGGSPYGASPYGAAPGYQQGAFMPYGAPVTAAVPMDYVVQ